MYRIRVVSDLDECQELWRSHVPADFLSDLWEVRNCFQRHFQRSPQFFVAENEHGLQGLLPLSWIEETGSFGYFPGETWNGKTWLEQNRFLENGNGAADAILRQLPHDFHLRYLLPLAGQDSAQSPVDEIGYLFLPPKYDFEIENYFQEFSHKSAKRLRKELLAFEGQKLTFRYNSLSDFEHLVKLNLDRFGANSYFYDSRFREGFRDLMEYLNQQGWLRITSVIVDGEIAAVDLGAIYNGNYTMLAGGASAAFPGVAKVINMHHMRYACEQRFECVDFLCGDFSWKKLFHLTPRPLYLLANDIQPVAAVDSYAVERVADVA
jgi:hypothetical protein